LANRKLGIQMNKQIVLLTVLVVLLNSCAQNATPNVIATSAATVTSTFMPTFTPTMTPTSTETPDPNQPADATGKDVNGNYIKTTVENGNTITYTWTDLGNLFSPDSHFFEWTRPAIVDDNGNLDPNGIQIMDNREYAHALPSTTRMLLTLMEAPGGSLYISHLTPTGDFSGENQASTFSAVVLNDLFRSLGLPGSKFDEFSSQFYSYNEASPLDITITTPDGVTQHWNPADDYTNTQVSADVALKNGFNSYFDETNPNLVYGVRIMAKNGPLSAFTAIWDKTNPNAPVDLSKLTDKQRARFVFAGLFEANAYANDTMPSYNNAPHFEPSVQNGTDKSVETAFANFLTFVIK
jgi:hypothetical protein